MTNALYAGSFDPMTRGHLDVIRRASKVFDKLYVGILINYAKNPMFTIEERVEMIREEAVPTRSTPHMASAWMSTYRTAAASTTWKSKTATFRTWAAVPVTTRA